MSTKDLSNPELLMQPVTWQGQTYYTSQYFHRQYVADSEYGGKYERPADFLRALRSIEAYSIYRERGDIVELTWNALKDSNDVLTQNLRQLKHLFEVTNWKPITLLNATAQLALHERLDDEMSQQISVAKNTQAAAQQLAGKALRDLLPTERATRELNAFLQIGQLLKTPEHIVQQEATFNY